MTDLENLNNMSLHDMIVNSLAIDFQNRLLTLVLNAYNEDTCGYDNLKLEFLGINKLNLEPLELDAKGFEDFDVYTHTVTQTDDTHAVQFTLLTDHGRPSIELSFTLSK